MLKVILSIIVALVVTSGYSQDKEKVTITTGHKDAITTSEGTTVSSVPVVNEQSNIILHLEAGTKNESNITIVKDSTYYDKTISDIEKKMTIIKADPIESKKAKENGWFEKNEALIMKLKQERASLISKSK